jgi:hypothetical protein
MRDGGHYNIGDLLGRDVLKAAGDGVLKGPVAAREVIPIVLR